MPDELFEYDFTDVEPLEGSAPVGGGKPHVEPGAYVAELKAYDDGLSKSSGNRRVHVQLSITGGPEDGTLIDDYFSLGMNRKGQKGVGWRRLAQWFSAMGVRSTGPVRITPAQIQQNLYGKRCIMHLRDETEEERPMLDEETGEQLVDESGNYRYWAARTYSRPDYYESLKKAQPKGQAAPPVEEPEPEPETAKAPVKTKAIAAAKVADEQDDLFGEND